MTREHDDLLSALAQHRALLRSAAEGLSDQAARSRPTVSTLCIGGILKHLTRVEKRWSDFMQIGTAAFGSFDESAYAAHVASFVMTEEETLTDLLAAYAEQCASTDAALAGLDLDTDHALPVTPWWPEGSRWSVRRAAVHLVAETAQHAGHADIIRESIDGKQSMA